MIRKDYIIRLIEQLGAFLWAIIFHKKLNQFDEAILKVDEAWKGLLDIDKTRIFSMDALSIINFYTKEDKLEKDPIEIIAVLLFEEADILELKNGITQQSQEYLQKSFILFYTLQTVSSANIYMEKLNAVYEKLRYEFLKPDAMHILSVYCESKGYYAKAEDCYYGRIEAGDNKAREECTAFYKRLLPLPDKILEQGKFSREEIIEGLEKLERMNNTGSEQT